jgi:ribosomal protein S18 acetylase RimI-like enzyme
VPGRATAADHIPEGASMTRTIDTAIHGATLHELRHGSVVVSTDPSRLDLDVIHGYLTGSYWAAGIPRETVTRAIQHSLCVGAYDGPRQVGFARAVSDRATFAYVADVFVLESHRGRGIGKQMMACLTSHPALQGLRLWTLFTRDAHRLYRQFGFHEPRYPDRLMERRAERPYA